MVFLFVFWVFSLGSVPAFAFADEGEESDASSVVAGVISQLSQAASEYMRGAIIPERTPALSIHDANEQKSMFRAKAALSSQYSSMDKGEVTPIRDQQDFGTCWAFSTIAAIESSLLAHGQVPSYDVDTLDLSERHLAYFTFNAETDPLGNTQGDKTQVVQNSGSTLMSDSYLDVGGNAFIAGLTLASWQGAVKEEVASYQELVDAYYADNKHGSEEFLANTALSGSIAYASDEYHLENMLRIAMTDISDVKQAIVEYGGVAAQIYYANYVIRDDGAGHCSLFNKSVESSNHAVTIVGWDDNYDRTLFGATDNLRPSKNGAWLAKNSYGTDSPGNGWIWISYEDRALNSEFASVYAFDMDNADTFSNIYQYDGSTADYYNYLPSGGSIANVYKVKGNKAEGGAERLDAVSFLTYCVNVNYSVQIYLNPSSSSDPTSGIPCFKNPHQGFASYEGLHSVHLPNSVYLREGDTYAVVVTFSHSDGSEIGYGVDVTTAPKNPADRKSTDWVYYYNNVSPAQSFELQSAGAAWHDLSDSTSLAEGNEINCCARLKAYTKNIAASSIPSGVNPFDFSKVQISLAGATATKGRAYNGHRQTPSVVAVYNGRTLVEGVDYSVTYRNNVEVGTAYADVKGKGSFTGTKSLAFTITKAELNLASISFKNKKFAYNGAKHSLFLQGKIPTYAKVSYSGNGKKAVGSYLVSAKIESKNPNYYVAAKDALKKATLKIVQGSQALSVAQAQTSKTVRYKKVMKASQQTSKVVVKGAKTKLTYCKVGGSSHLLINKKTGKIRVAKNTAQGKYQIKVKISAIGSKKTYAAASKVVAVTVLVK